MPQTAALLSMQPFSFSGLGRSLAEMSVLSLLWCVILLVILLVCVVGWMIRGAHLRRVSQADAAFTASFRGSSHLLALFQTGIVFPRSPRAAVYQNACRELSWHLLGTDSVDKNYMARLRTAGRITPSQAEAVNRTSRHVTDEATRSFLSNLDGMAVKSLPLIGLAGSLVCLLDGLGRQQFGIGMWSSALWPLLTGLLFFVVGTICERRLAEQARQAVTRVRDFAVEVSVALDRMFVDHRQPMEPLPSLGGMGMVDAPNFSQPPAETSRTPTVGVG